MESVYLDLAFLLVALAFLMFVCNWVIQSEKDNHNRRIMEMREFGPDALKIRAIRNHLKRK